MVEVIKIADGHGNTAGLTAFGTMEPWMPNIDPGIRRVAMSKAIYEDGQRSAELRWDPKVPNSVVAAARTLAGLDGGAIANEVTVRLPSNEDRTEWANYNATAYVPEESQEFERKGWRGFVIQLLFLEVIT